MAKKTEVEWEAVSLESDLDGPGDYLGQKIHVQAGLGFQVMLWDGADWRISPESDTGAQDGSAYLTSGWKWPSLGSGIPDIRRVGNSVHFNLYYADGTDAARDQFTAHTVVAYPYGGGFSYGPIGESLGLMDGRYFDIGRGYQLFQSSTNILLYEQAAVPGTDAVVPSEMPSYLGAVIEYICFNPWPTAPPGAEA
jgi:hypothetical protein